MAGRLATLLALALLLSGGSVAWGGAGYTLHAVPSLRLSVEEDFNALDREGGGPEDTILVVHPELSGDLRTMGGSLRLRVGFDSRLYAKYHDQLNYFGWTRDATLRTVTPLQVTPRLSLSPSGGISYRDETRVYDPENMGVGPPAAGPNPLPEGVYGRTRVREVTGGLGAILLVSPLDVINLSGFWRNYAYIDNAALGTGSTSYGGDATLLHTFTPNLSTGLYGNVSNGDYDDGTAATTVSGGVQANWSVTPATSVIGRGGYSFSHTHGGDTSASPDGTLTVNRITPVDRFSMSAFHRYTSGGGLGATTLRTGGQGTWDHQFSPSTSGRLEAGWEKRKDASTSGGTTVDQDVLTASANLSWRPLRYLALHATGTSINRIEHMAGRDGFRKEVFSVGFTFFDEYQVL